MSLLRRIEQSQPQETRVDYSHATFLLNAFVHSLSPFIFTRSTIDYKIEDVHEATYKKHHGYNFTINKWFLKSPEEKTVDEIFVSLAGAQNNSKNRLNLKIGKEYTP